jgi:hypothetical protein
MLAITTHSGTELEERGREQLERLLDAYDLERWLFTREIIVRSFVAPHSHPVLTVNTRQIDDDDGCLGTFLQEQFHWYAVNRLEQTEAAVREFREIYPEAPVGPPEGAKSEYSSYLHLIICTLELDALTELLGEERARQVIEKRSYYTWPYQRALNDGVTIRRVLEHHGLELP